MRVNKWYAISASENKSLKNWIKTKRANLKYLFQFSTSVSAIKKKSKLCSIALWGKRICEEFNYSASKRESEVRAEKQVETARQFSWGRLASTLYSFKNVLQPVYCCHSAALHTPMRRFSTGYTAKKKKSNTHLCQKSSWRAAQKLVWLCNLNN